MCGLRRTYLAQAVATSSRGPARRQASAAQAATSGKAAGNEWRGPPTQGNQDDEDHRRRGSRYPDASMQIGRASLNEIEQRLRAYPPDETVPRRPYHDRDRIQPP